MGAATGRNDVFSGWTHAGNHRVYVRVPAALKENGAPGNGDRPDYGGSPIVLVHGIGTSSRSLKPLIRALGAQRAVFAPDLPGFGLSDDPIHPLDVPGLADALRRWMLDNEIAPAVPVGVSFGSQVAVDLAARYPEIVEALVLVGPTMAPELHDGLGLATRIARNAPHVPPSLAPSVVHDLLDAGPWRALRTLKRALDDPFEAKLAQVQAPVLVARAKHDRLAPKDWIERVVEALPDAEHGVVPGGHVLGPRAAARLAPLVEGFLSEHEPEAGERRAARQAEPSSNGSSSVHWIVDGMNVIGSRPDGWWRNRARAWRRLAQSLDRYARRRGDRVSLVLDGRRPRGWRDEELVQTSFAEGGPDAADEVIVARVESDPHPEALRVVTSDRRLGKRVRALGAETVGASKFRGRLEG
jgi:pimeloyl-ACP methyl ester carboxylesterase/predicted RNA-binding protein with PIN domain